MKDYYQILGVPDNASREGKKSGDLYLHVKVKD